MQNEMLFYTFIEWQNVVVLSRDYAPSQMTYIYGIVVWLFEPNQHSEIKKICNATT